MLSGYSDSFTQRLYLARIIRGIAQRATFVPGTTVPFVDRRNSALARATRALAAIVCIAAVPSGGWSQAVLQAPLVGGNSLPHLGDAGDMGPRVERRLGDRIAREIYRDPDYLDDPITMEFVQSIWQPLLAAARLRGELPGELDEAFAWKIVLGRDRSINAFALPGGYMGLHLGLIAAVSSRDELASVMAHELSHITQRHISRNMTHQAAQVPWVMGAMILAMLAASKSPDGASAAMIGGQAVAAQTQLNFSRDIEREADRIGFAVMTQAGFAPQGFVSMFEKLQQASRLQDSGNFPYLRSHPLTTERIADMQSRIPLARPGVVPRGQLLEFEQAMIAARARVLANSKIDDLRSWAGQTDAAYLASQSAQQQVGNLYGATLATIKMREFPQAQALLQRLMQQVQSDAPAQRLARWLGVELALAQNQGEAALDILLGQRVAGQPARDVSRTTSLISSRAELFLLAQAALHCPMSTQKEIGIVPALQTWVAEHPDDSLGWQYLSSTYAAQGRTLGAVRAEAEVSVAQMNYPAALTRLRAAQDLVRRGGADHIEASIIDTRTRQVDAKVREMALEMAKER